jgi:hypothetical protein
MSWGPCQSGVACRAEQWWLDEPERMTRLLDEDDRRRERKEPTEAELARARRVRETEKARYLEVNAAVYPDARLRWRKYEDLIRDKYAGKYRADVQRSLDEAWVWRDRGKHE